MQTKCFIYISGFAKNLFVQFKKLQQKSRNSTVARKYVKRRSVNSSTAKCMLKVNTDWNLDIDVNLFFVFESSFLV